MAIITGVNQLVQTFRGKAAQARKDTSQIVKVSYGSPTVVYAIYVHEDLEARHPNGGQAKYLETPARQMRRQLAAVVGDVYRRTHDLVKAEQAAAQLLLDASQMLVPVATGALKRSGRVVTESPGQTAESPNALRNPPTV